jgi:thymidylate synthase
MSANVVGNNINEVFIESLRYLWGHGKKLNIRGSEVCEVTNFTYELTNVNNNVITIPYRYNNFPAVCFETLWVLSGCNNLKYLKYFLPNCVDYSDNDKTWGGAYGPRIRYSNNQNFRWQNIEEPNPHILNDDQIFHILKTLIIDKFSRQAIIMIGDSTDYSTHTETKDRPCNFALQFYIRNDKLNCTVFQRSGDVIWGTFNINIFEWTTLQRIIADCLGVETGSLTHHITSFHYYTKQHGMMIDKILANSHLIPDIYNDDFDMYVSRSRLDKEHDEHEIYKQLEYHYANIAFSYETLCNMILHNDGLFYDLNNDFINKMFITNENHLFIKKLFDCAKLYIFLKNKKYDLICELFSVSDLDIYYIAMLEYAIRYSWKNYDEDILPIAEILDYPKSMQIPLDVEKYVHWGLNNENKKSA